MHSSRRLLLEFRACVLVVVCCFVLCGVLLYGFGPPRYLHSFPTLRSSDLEDCIEHGFEKFDAGAQGEHKLLRGFEPVETCSYHWIENPDFEHAIANFLNQESQHTRDYIREARDGLPYKAANHDPLVK